MPLPNSKRKHKTLTIKEKYEILDRLNRNESMSKLAKEYDVGRSTIYDIKKNRENIQKFISTADCRLDRRKTFKKAEHPDLEEALYKWYIEEINKNTPISGPLLAEKAKFIYKEITKKDDFVASKGWLDGFKSRHGIRLTTVTYEKFSHDISSAEPHKCLISVTPEIIEDVATVTQHTSENLDNSSSEEESGLDEENVLPHLFDNGQEVDNDNELVTTFPQVTENSVVDAFEVCMQWAQQSGASRNELLVLKKLKDRATISYMVVVNPKRVKE